jgi:DNA-binding MarR family transcriptional regulator
VDIEAVETNIDLTRVVSQLLASADAFFARFGFSRGRFLVLVTLLFEEEGLNSGKLAEHFQVTPATMTGLVDTLLKDGYVKRRDDPSDRRVSRVVITERGRRFMDELLPAHYHRAAVLMSRLSPADRAALSRIMRKVEAGLDALRIEETEKASTAKSA